MSKAVIYARVSSTGERLSTERQVADLTRYAAATDVEVVAVYEEKVSRAKMAACLEFLRGGGVRAVNDDCPKSKEILYQKPCTKNKSRIHGRATHI